MRHQIADRDVVFGGNRIDLRLARRCRCRGRRAGRLDDRHLRVLELRNEARHRIGQPQLAFFHQHQDRDAGDRLRHRRDAEDRVLAHRRLRFEIHLALRLEVRDLAAPRHHRDRAGDLAALDVALDHLVDAQQALGREADGFGFVGRKGGRGQRDREEDDAERGAR